jgi:hypothetical protein
MLLFLYQYLLVVRKLFSIVLFILECRPYILITGGVWQFFLLIPEKTEGIIPRVCGIPPLIIASPDTTAGVAFSTAVPQRFFTSYHPSHLVPPVCSSK